MTDTEAMDCVQQFNWSLITTWTGQWVAITQFGATEPAATAREALRAALTIQASRTDA